MLDEIVFIDKDEIPDRQARFLACNRFVHNLFFMVVLSSFSVGVYKYARPGSLYHWVFVFKVACGASYESQSFVGSIDDAVQQAPIL